MTQFDLIVIGSGLAGCITALAAAQKSLKVMLISSEVDSDYCNTGRAQGGIIYKGTNDSKLKLKNDIFKAGCSVGYKKAIQHLCNLGSSYVEQYFFQDLNIPFDHKKDNTLDLTSEGAHSVPRIIHVSDFTGRSIHEHIFKAVNDHPKIKIKKDCMAIDLLTTNHSSINPQDVYEPNQCFGAYIYHKKKKKVFSIIAKETVIATGGLGGLYVHSTNPENATGDGIAMAKRAGVRLANMEYVQFHPTGLYHPFKNRFLLSESLRGEGAILINHLGEEFMPSYHPQKNLAPRDVVARAIYDQMVKHKKSFVYLDISHKDSKWIKKRFPMISKTVKGYGYDLTKGPVPVVPVAHYSCGGILVDLKGQSSLKGLRAVGEVSCTGIHGANRLASTSLLECLVWGVETANDIALHKKDPFQPPDILPWQYEYQPQDLDLIHQDWQTLRNTMWNYVGPVRSTKRLERAALILGNLQREVENFYDSAELSPELIKLRNGIDAAMCVLQEATRRTKSIGCHYYVKN